MINDISHTNLEFANRNKQLEAMRMPYGVDRRKAILSLLDGKFILCNVKHQWNLEKDKDLQYLIKKGKIKRMKRVDCSITKTALILS